MTYNRRSPGLERPAGNKVDDKICTVTKKECSAEMVVAPIYVKVEVCGVVAANASRTTLE